MKALRCFFSIVALAYACSSHADGWIDVPMTARATGTYYVKAGVEHISESDFLVDTGSGFVVVDQDFVSALTSAKKARRIRQVNLKTADGQLIKATVYKLDYMTIGGVCRIQDVEVVVLPTANKNILGLSALSKAAPFTFSLQPPTLRLSHCLAK